MTRSLRPLLASPWTQGALLLALPFLAYGASLFHGYSPTDDAILIRNNLAIRGITWETLRLMFTTLDPELYIPLTLLSYATNYLISGLNPWSYHLANVILHGANAVLVLLLVRELTGGRAGAFFVAALFAVHPLNTEAVAWLAGRKDLLPAFFFFLSMLLYAVSLRRPGIFRPYGRAWTYGAAVLAGLCAMLAKGSAVTLPAALLLVEFLVRRDPVGQEHSWPTGSEFLRVGKRLLPFILLAAIFLIVGRIGKERVLSEVTLWQVILMSGKSTVFYLQKLLLPIRLSPFYPYRGEISLWKFEFLAPLLLIGGLTVAAAATFRRSRLPAFALLFFLANLAPTYFIFSKGGYMYFAVDRYAYVPMIGLLVALAPGIEAVGRRVITWGDQRTMQRLCMGTSALLVGLFLILSRAQTATWENGEKQFRESLKRYPETTTARAGLAAMLRKMERYDEAFTILKGGLVYGDDVTLLLEAARIYAAVGQVTDSEEQLAKARALAPKNPDPIYALGTLRQQQGRIEEAKAFYAEAAVLDESFVAPRVKLAEFALERGEIENAEKWLQEGLRWNQSSFDVHRVMGQLRSLQDRHDEAIVHFEKAVALYAYDIPTLLEFARSLIAAGRAQDAQEPIRQILKIDQRNAEVLKLQKEIQVRIP